MILVSFQATIRECIDGVPLSQDMIFLHPQDQQRVLGWNPCSGKHWSLNAISFLTSLQAHVLPEPSTWTLLKFHSTYSYSYEPRRIQPVLWEVQLTPVAATLKRRIARTLHEEVPTCISGCILVHPVANRPRKPAYLPTAQRYFHVLLRII